MQRDRGPFAESSRLDPSLEGRAAAVPGVRGARAYTYQVVQRDHAGRQLRLALVGLAWPDYREAPPSSWGAGSRRRTAEPAIRN